MSVVTEIRLMKYLRSTTNNRELVKLIVVKDHVAYTMVEVLKSKFDAQVADVSVTQDFGDDIGTVTSNYSR